MFYQSEFFTYLKEERHSMPSTIKMYRWFVKKLVTFCGEREVASVESLTEEITMGFIGLLRVKYQRDKKFFDLVYVLRVYFEFLRSKGIIISSPLTNFKFPKKASNHQENSEVSHVKTEFYQQELVKYLKEERQLSASTIEIYRSLVTKLETFCGERKILSVKSATVKDTYDFIDFLRKKNYAESKFYESIYELRVYFAFLQVKGFIFLSTLTNFRFPKISKGRYPVLKQEEIESILAGIKKLDDECFQGKVMLEILYSSALRPREIRDLKIQDINIEQGILFISQSKEKKDRVVPIGKKALFLLVEYINTARKKNLRSHSPENVFLGKISGRLHSTKSIRDIINHTLKKNGFERIKPYSMRCTAATVLFLNGMGIAHINKLLGHSGFLVTKRYLRLDDLSLRKELEAKHPRFIKKEGNNDF
jgi:site-specific recombinase XerD